MSTEKVLLTLKEAGKPLKAAEIAEVAGLARKDVDLAVKRLKKDGLIVSPKVCYWQPQ